MTNQITSLDELESLFNRTLEEYRQDFLALGLDDAEFTELVEESIQEYRAVMSPVWRRLREKDLYGYGRELESARLLLEDYFLEPLECQEQIWSWGFELAKCFDLEVQAAGT